MVVLRPLAAAVAVLVALTLPVAEPGLGLRSASAATASWPTYHADNLRSGLNSTDPTYRSLVPAWSKSLDGQMYAEPLFVGGTVLAVTENNSVYAFAASTGAMLWHANVGTPVPASSLPCGNVDPVGITSTPVADPATNTLFVVALLNNPIRYTLAAFDIASGLVRWQEPLADVAKGFDPKIENQRGALTLANGNIYIPFGGRAGDCGNYRGWVMSYPENGNGLGSPNSVPLPEGADHEGGLWQPAGGSVDASGNLYYSSGNTCCGSAYDFGESVIKFSSTLGIADYFYPANWQALNAGDVDIGSTGPLVLPGGDVFQVGKSGDGYLLDQSSLGGADHQTPRFTAHVCPNQSSDAAFGGDAFDGAQIYVPCTRGVVALSYNAAAHSFSPAWQAAGIYNPPIVAGGLVWVAAGTNLYGLSPATGQVAIQIGLGAAASHFGTPAAVNSLLFVPAGSTLVAFNAVNHWWTPVSGSAVDVAIDGGQTFVLGTNPVPGGYGIWQRSGGGWSEFPGGGTAVAVDSSGNPWVVNGFGEIWRWTGAAWQQLAGSGRYVAAGADGSVYVLGTNTVAGGYGIWRWAGTAWVPVDGGLIDLAVGADGALWGVNSSTAIFHRPSGGQWSQVPGSATEVAAADFNDAWVTGTNAVPGGHGMWEWHGASWTPLPGGAGDLAVDARNPTNLCAINAAGGIYTYN